MSITEYDMPRHYASHSDLSYSSYYFGGRNDPLALSHSARVDPRGYHMGGPVGGARGQLGMERDEPTYDHGGPSRRRIAVACARCRKRKIKCSGDGGNGLACTACRSAGVDAGLCQFHRVGSDNVQKVMDHLHIAQSLTGMAHSNGVMPIYPAIPNSPTYSRLTSLTYPQLDTKPTYPSTWSVPPYSEDTSPVENYGLDQSAAYLSDSVAMPHPNMYATSCRWTYPPSRPYQQATSMYYDQQPSYDTNGTPYTSSSNTRNTTMNEPTSPMNMSSLQLTLPERPHPRRYPVAAPRRQLPAPQPNPTQTSRNALDNLQDQRLRSGQANRTSSMSTGTTLIKPHSWSSSSGNQVSASTATPIDTSTLLPTTTDGALNFLATSAIGDDTNTMGTATQFELNFTSSPLIDGITASVPTAPYSNFRASRSYRQPSTQVSRHDSQTSLYSLAPNKPTKRDSLHEDDSEDCKLVNGGRYTPLTHLQPQNPSAHESLQRESFENRNVPPHRSSMGNLNAAF